MFLGAKTKERLKPELKIKVAPNTCDKELAGKLPKVTLFLNKSMKNIWRRAL